MVYKTQRPRLGHRIEDLPQLRPMCVVYSNDGIGGASIAYGDLWRTILKRGGRELYSIDDGCYSVPRERYGESRDTVFYLAGHTISTRLLMFDPQKDKGQLVLYVLSDSLDPRPLGDSLCAKVGAELELRGFYEPADFLAKARGPCRRNVSTDMLGRPDNILRRASRE